MRFVDGGPDIPEELIRQHLAGEVVFVVGAGLSQNARLPDFRTLVEKVHQRLHLDFPPKEAAYPAEWDAHEKVQWDRLLGMLEERVGDLTPLRPTHPNKLRRVVSEILADDSGDVSAHANVLRIASDRFGRPRVVTTNFDVLFERAWPEASSEHCISIAGPGLPAVTARDFAGVLHLHGRLSHGGWGGTDLVLTSSDFGEAYLRSGWAARFVYDLLRRFTVVFIGYSADDPPMRYMLEAAFSGRFQFPDMKRAYAIAESKPGHEGNERQKWRAKGLIPLIFENPGDFSPLYRTLSDWAECHTDPLAWSEASIRSLVGRPHEVTSEEDRKKVSLLVRAFSDTATLSRNAASCDWIDCLAPPADERVRGRRNHIWFQDRLASVDAVAWLLKQHAGIRHAVAEDVKWLVRHRSPAEPYATFWRLFLRSADAPSHRIDTDWQFGTDDGEKVRLAAESLRPRLMLEKRFRIEDSNDPPARLADLCRISFRCRDPHAAAELREGWPTTPEIRVRLLAALDRALEEACDDLADAGQMGLHGRSPFNDPDLCHDPDDLDRQFFGIDAFRVGWRRSPPDEHDHSFAPIVRLLTWLWTKVADENPDRARRAAADWITRRPAIYRRMAFWCATASGQGPCDEASRMLAEVEPSEFHWHRNAEFARFWCLRWNVLPASTTKRLEDGILAWANRMADDAGEAGNRQQIRDWYLLMETGRIVTQGGVLSSPMVSERDAAISRLTTFPPGVGISEGLYGSSFSFSGLSGDLTAVEGVPTHDLVDAVDKLERERDEQENLWEVLCQRQPGQAWEALLARPDWPERRWRQFLSAYDAKVQTPSAGEVLSKLLDMPSECLSKALHSVSSLVQGLAASETFSDRPLLLSVWDRVWEQLAVHGDGGGDVADHGDLDTQALNRPAGKLAWALCDMLPDSSAGAGLDLDIRERLVKLLSLKDDGKLLALAILAPQLGYLFHVDEDWTVHYLLPSFEAHDAAGRALLGHWARGGRLASKLFARLAPSIERALVESASGPKPSAALAHLVASAAFRALSNDREIGITLTDARRMLTRCPSESLADIAWALARDVNQGADWPARILAFFENVWPLSVDSKSADVSRHLVRIPAKCGDDLPRAVEAITSLIDPIHVSYVRMAFDLDEDKGIVASFPKAILQLVEEATDLSEGPPSDLAEFLDGVAAADPTLMKDWRFRRLKGATRGD